MQFFDCPYRPEGIFKFSYETIRGKDKITGVVTDLKKPYSSSTLFKGDVDIAREKHQDHKSIVDALAEGFIVKHGKSIGFRDYERYLEFNYKQSVQEFEETLFKAVPQKVIEAGIWHPKLVGAFLYHTLGRDKFELLAKVSGLESVRDTVNTLLGMVTINSLEVSEEVDKSATFTGSSSVLQKANIFSNPPPKQGSPRRGTRPEKVGYSLGREFEVEDLYGNSKVFILTTNREVVGNIECQDRVNEFTESVVEYHNQYKHILAPLEGKVIRVISAYNFTSSHGRHDIAEAFITEVTNKIRRSGVRHVLVEVKENGRIEINDAIKLFERCDFKLVFDENCPRIQEDRVVLMRMDFNQSYLTE